VSGSGGCNMAAKIKYAVLKSQKTQKYKKQKALEFNEINNNIEL
jgi:hypothetical protein